MKKKDLIKTMLLSAVMLSAVCVLGGCADSGTNEMYVLYQQEPPRETDLTVPATVEEESVTNKT
ncbi:MAG: hypothetical protein K2P35_01615, partial [Lachnospiraceae bacterium]|nr:hypothetical protein [Lachnospiraceae bacterium]